MGFKFWHEALVFVVVFGALVTVPCYFIALFGTRMLNEMGNFPSRSDEIQTKSLWKVLVVFLAAAAGLALFFHICY